MSKDILEEQFKLIAINILEPLARDDRWAVVNFPVALAPILGDLWQVVQDEIARQIAELAAQPGPQTFTATSSQPRPLTKEEARRLHEGEWAPPPKSAHRSPSPFQPLSAVERMWAFEDTVRAREAEHERLGGE